MGIMSGLSARQVSIVFGAFRGSFEPTLAECLIFAKLPSFKLDWLGSGRLLILLFGGLSIRATI